MDASPRHRRETSTDTASFPRIEEWPPPLAAALSSRAFDAVSPMRHPERYEPSAPDRDPSGDGPVQYPGELLSRVDDLSLARR